MESLVISLQWKVSFNFEKVTCAYSVNISYNYNQLRIQCMCKTVFYNLFISDEHSREPLTFIAAQGLDQPIKPISDIGIDYVNELMFNQNQ